LRAEELRSGESRFGGAQAGRSLAGQTRADRSFANGVIDAPAAGSGGSTSLLLALLSAASRSGSWCAVVGMPALGALAAAESGIALDRLAFVPNPGPEWPTVVAALIDGMDLVVVAVPGPVAPTLASRLAARVRQRGCVLVPYGNWAGADVTLQVTRGRWEGLGAGHGRLRRREVTIIARGRGAAARPKELTMWMPGITTPPPIPPPPAGRTLTGPAAPADFRRAVAGPDGLVVVGRAVAASADPVVVGRSVAPAGVATASADIGDALVGGGADGRAAVRRRRGSLIAVRSA